MDGFQPPSSDQSVPRETPTYSVSELCGEVRDLLRAGPTRWVAGEVQRARLSRAGHLYFELVEKGDGDEVLAKLEAVSWRSNAAVIRRQLQEMGREFVDGIEVRCRGDVDFYPPFGRLQLIVKEIDSVFLLGRLSRRRQEVLDQLVKEGLYDRNRQLTLPPLPLDIALVTSEGSAAYHDFLSSLQASGFGFRIFFVHAAVQGRGAEEEIASALETAGAAGVDCTVLIRGGGAKTDLAAFDSRRVAEAVARSAVPVVTGLGHEIDLSIADRVAHTHTRTPTQAADVLVGAVDSVRRLVETAAERMLRESEARLGAARSDLRHFRSGLRLASLSLQRADHAIERIEVALSRSTRSRLRGKGRWLGDLGSRLEVAAPRLLGRRVSDAEARRERIISAARSRMHIADLEVDSLTRLCSQLSPQQTLARGFSITRDARGRVVRSSGKVEHGEVIETELADGLIVSRVE